MEAKSTTPPTESNSEGQKVSVVIENLSVENPTPGHKYKDVIEGSIHHSRTKISEYQNRYEFIIVTYEEVLPPTNKNGTYLIELRKIESTE
ncbi:hypothetical protein [Pseudomonas sp. Irchel 3E19]|uniref:hypothetical protein n=1 Tax=Pseudomonas sp. Irchel 3E19 TaxID=2008981 RepID=UPI000BA47880|nr:hypothetical protein [Pseudomonas sp. Irchel 3E19]